MSGSNVVRLPVKTGRKNFQAVTTSLTPTWTTSALTADQVVHQNLRVLRARSREQIRNNDYAKRFIGMVKSHVVGPDGFAYQARTVNRDGTQDKAVNNVIEEAWREHGRAENFDVEQQLSRTAFLRLWIETIAKDGEAIIRKRKGEDMGRFGCSYQLVDPEMLDVTYNDDLKDGRIVRFGIELNSLGRRIAYHFRGDPADPKTAYYGYGGERVRVSASEIWHHYLIENVGQKRGIPWVSTPLLRMQMLAGYEEAALVNARTGASKMGFYTQEQTRAPIDPKTLATTTEAGELRDSVEPGAFDVLPPGIDFKSFDASYPNGEFADFSKECKRGIAAGLNVSYYKLANDLEEVNFATGRIGELEDRELWKWLQGWTCEVFLESLRDDWLIWVLRTGQLQVGRGTLSDANFEKYRRGHFQGRRWQWADPLKASQANKLDLDNYLTSPQRVMRENGLDPDEVLSDWERWMQRLGDVGLPLPQAAQAVIGQNDEKQTDKDN